MPAIPREYPIPTGWNTLHVVVCSLAYVALLAAASRADSLAAMVGFGALFAIVMIPVYALLHEASHETLLPGAAANRWVGRWLAAMFVVPFSFYKHCHWRHHLKNRTDIELWDLVRPTDVRWRRVANLYGMLFGVGYALTWVSVALFAVAPGLVYAGFFQQHTEIAGFLEGSDTPRKRATFRFEAWSVIAVHVALWLALGLRPLPTLILFGMHGFLWSSQNYVNHAFSRRDVVNGAHNLWMPRVLLPIYLNFNLHLAHHQHPSVPWNHLPKLVPEGSVQLAFFRNYLRLWSGPRPTTEPDPKTPEVGANA